jgi:hypothetical protein
MPVASSVQYYSHTVYIYTYIINPIYFDRSSWLPVICILETAVILSSNDVTTAAAGKHVPANSCCYCQNSGGVVSARLAVCQYSDEPPDESEVEDT